MSRMSERCRLESRIVVPRFPTSFPSLQNVDKGRVEKSAWPDWIPYNWSSPTFRRAGVALLPASKRAVSLSLIPALEGRPGLVALCGLAADPAEILG
jgi:hypothetical protein